MLLPISAGEYATCRLVVLEGWSHYDLYDQPKPVHRALAKLAPFYKENL